ncbi:MAG: energy transducer TonB [Burkholderiales bacterium]
MALLVSMVLHALAVISLRDFSIHERVFDYPLDAPLIIRMEKLPESNIAVPMVVRNKSASPRNKSPDARQVSKSVPAQDTPSVSHPGVSVSQLLYQKPIPARVGGALLESGEFLRPEVLGQRPQAQVLSIPRYPLTASLHGISGSVVVILFVDEYGRVADAAAVDASESFSAYAKQVAADLRGSVFMPAMQDGRAVKAVEFVMVKFDAGGVSASEGTAGAVDLNRSPAPVPRQ